MPRKGRKGYGCKRKDKRDKLREQRLKQTGQSINSLNCPIKQDQSFNSLNCPIKQDQSVNSLNCPIKQDQSVNSINCPIKQDQSVNSLNCPIEQDQSVNSINCPIKHDQSVNSINCPIKQDQSANSINCPIKQDQSLNSLNCPIKQDQSVNSINCPIKQDQSLNSINCLVKQDQSVNSRNCQNGTELFKFSELAKSNESIKLKKSIRSNKSINETKATKSFISNESIKISQSLKSTIRSNLFSESVESNLESEAMDLNLDYKAMDLNLDSESIRLSLDFKATRINLNFEATKANLDYEATKTHLDSEAMDINLDSESDEISLDFQATKSNTNSESLKSKVNYNGKSGSDYRNTSSDTKMKQLNIQKNYKFKEPVDESLIVHTDNTHLDSNGNFITEIEQENDGLKMFIHENKGTIVENSLEVSRSLVSNFVVQGSFHQGDERFGNNSGKQCVANCLLALANSKLKKLKDWNQMYLDKVLNGGNKIYSRIHGDNIHLLVSDLPGMIEMSGKLLKISRKESITAVINNYGTIDFSEFGNSLPLDQALQESLIDYDACFICAYDTTFLALKHNQDLLLFDSHARNKFGLQDSDGKSLLLKLNNLDHLYQYCCNMMAGSSQNQLSNELLESSNQASTSNSQLSENQEKENRSYNEIIKTPENLTMHDHISPEIFKFNSYSYEKNNEVHNDEGITDTEFDVEILSTIDNFYDFKPLNTDSKKKLCTIVKIPTKKNSKKITPNIYNMGPPSTTKTITGDGNCLFCAISYALSNRQEFFGNIIFAATIYNCRTAYTNTENGRKNVWGTELEILACADLLKTDIYTFYNGTWIKYSSSQIYSNNSVNDQAIYLQHVGNINHYEVVTNVTPKSLSPNPLQCRQDYAEKYQVDRKSEIKYQTDDEFRARKTNISKRKYWENEGIRSKKLCLGIKKYAENETRRENLIQAGIKKYQDDEDYRKALIESGIEKYKEDEVYRDALIKSGIQKYQEDHEYREKLTQASIQKYKSDEKHKEYVKQASTHKYADNDAHRLNIKQQTSMRREKP
ncbi:unnamed protein product [Mytilus coruscus]|uniref:OTU domain-containing protein n=1 Tax=Mytilus coruscus TaxID=42192 RepID=A0A6J8A1D7_MYTCO|nr:unnamed protein product [Mytilus coruscus]